MATTRLIPLHTGKARNFGKAIRNVIGYVSNPKKTHQGETLRIPQKVSKTNVLRGRFTPVHNGRHACVSCRQGGFT